MPSLMAVRRLARIALLLAMVLAVQGLRLPPPVTGPLVNFMLVLSTALAGTAGGVMIGLFTPWAALLLGILPPPLAPAVPFIMAGNAAYCLSFGALSDRFPGWAGALPGVAAGAVLKFALIAAGARFLLALPPPLVEVLLFPQLFNALLGGLAALPAAFRLRRVVNLT